MQKTAEQINNINFEKSLTISVKGDNITIELYGQTKHLDGKTNGKELLIILNGADNEANGKEMETYVRELFRI